MTDILQLNLTREQATVIHGIVQLHMAKRCTASLRPDLLEKVNRDVPKWTKQAELTDTVIINQCFGELMRKIATFIDGKPPE